MNSIVDIAINFLKEGKVLGAFSFFDKWKQEHNLEESFDDDNSWKSIHDESFLIQGSLNKSHKDFIRSFITYDKYNTLYNIGSARMLEFINELKEFINKNNLSNEIEPQKGYEDEDKATVRIHLEGDLEEFTFDHLDRVLGTLLKELGITKDELQVCKIEKGSVILTANMPGRAANLLMMISESGLLDHMKFEFLKIGSAINDLSQRRLQSNGNKGSGIKWKERLKWLLPSVLGTIIATSLFWNFLMPSPNSCENMVPILNACQNQARVDRNIISQLQAKLENCGSRNCDDLLASRTQQLRNQANVDRNTISQLQGKLENCNKIVTNERNNNENNKPIANIPKPNISNTKPEACVTITNNLEQFYNYPYPEKVCSLTLIGQNLGMIPQNLGRFKNLVYLNLASNEITTIENLNDLSQLEHIVIHNNLIKEIKGLENLNKLKKLDIEHNMVEKISGLSNLKNLTYLSLYGNRISEIKGLEQLYLTELQLEFNKIENVLGLENKIRLKGLKYIVLTDNPLLRNSIDYLNNIKRSYPETNFRY